MDWCCTDGLPKGVELAIPVFLKDFSDVFLTARSFARRPDPNSFCWPFCFFEEIYYVEESCASFRLIGSRSSLDVLIILPSIFLVIALRPLNWPELRWVFSFELRIYLDEPVPYTKLGWLLFGACLVDLYKFFWFYISTCGFFCLF